MRYVVIGGVAAIVHGVPRATFDVDFAGAWGRRIERDVSGTKYWLLSRPDLIASKRAAARPKDLEDVRVLEGSDG